MTEVANGSAGVGHEPRTGGVAHRLAISHHDDFSDEVHGQLVDPSMASSSGYLTCASHSLPPVRSW